ncbi:MAG: choice-of-anchor tandem repeat GloVer-containing protein [Terriglobia bacterium]
MSKAKLSWRKTACALFLIYAAAAIASPGQTFKTLANLDGTNGTQPLAAVVQGTDGNLYGTTDTGGANYAAGTIFRMTPAGILTTFYNFCSQANCTDGSNPYAGLALGTDGNLYGTTLASGAYNGGTVFKITRTGALTTLYSFCAQSGCADGSQPMGGLVLGTDGNFYGTTAYGGNGSACPAGIGGCGTAFKITPAGTLTTLYNFCSQTNCADGDGPESALALGTDGNFYGPTLFGGSDITNAGTVFKLTPKGELKTLYTFCGQSPCTDGESPWGGLVLAKSGNFYGTTYSGGANNGYEAGTVFKISPGGTFTPVYSFCAQTGCTDGGNPRAGLALGADGNLYGVTEVNGGPEGVGTAFRITPGGALTTLHSFDGTDGAYPEGGLFQATNGGFYGTTGGGGPYGAGTVFNLGVGLHPFIETVPAAGKVGQRVLILGNNLTGSTSVTFNGISATFTVSSRTLITATVPVGATSGNVQVTTPSGTLTSNAPFRVLP